MKDVSVFEGRYAITEEGNIWSYPNKNNLEWVTNKENSDHAFKIGLMKKPLSDGEVIELRKLCLFFSCRKVALAWGLNPAAVWDIFKGRRYAEV